MVMHVCDWLEGYRVITRSIYGVLKTMLVGDRCQELSRTFEVQGHKKDEAPDYG